MEAPVAIYTSNSPQGHPRENHGWTAHEEQENSDNDNEQEPEEYQLDPESSYAGARKTASKNSITTASPSAATDTSRSSSPKVVLRADSEEDIGIPPSPAGAISATSNEQSHHSTSAGQETRPVRAHPDLSVPPETPRPFPLSPPRPSQTLEEPIYVASPLATSDSDPEESLPTVEELAAKMRPSYGSQPSQIRWGTSRSMTISAEDGLDIKMDVDPILPSPVSTPVKRQPMDSPHILKSSRKKKKYGYPIVETAERTYIDLVSSASPSENEGPSRPRKNENPTSISQNITLSRPTPRPKRKRTPLGSSKATIAPANCTPRPDPTSSGVIASTSLAASGLRPPPRKRSKTGFRRHPTHWQLDGNVQVQIGKVRFRLQRSRLMRHCDWFKHTFEKDQDAPELEDGVYYLDRIGVDEKDFEVLLDALDDAITYVHNRPPFHIMASIMRASSALSCDAFEEWAIQYLQSMWSPDLADLSMERLPFASESIALARYSDILGVRKRAMYELVRLEGFGQGKAREEGQRHELSQADMKALVRAREQLTSAWFLAAASPSKNSQECAGVRVPVDGAGGVANHHEQDAPVQATPARAIACTTTDSSLVIQAHAKLVHASRIFEEYHTDPVNGLRALIDAPWGEEGFCDACVERMRRMWEETREKLWDNLDVWFGV